jgi:uroporphyrinogen-III synthase
MDDKATIGPLSGRRMAIPESRELDRLARLLEAEGAETLRCPLVAITDTPDPLPVQEWLGRFPFDDLIFYTGEGLHRLHSFARRFDLEAGFLDGLRSARKVTRGPKPERALRELGLKSDLRTAAPTTEGLLATLSALDLRGRRVGVQLYPGAPETRLTGFLQGAGAEPDTVLPYVYASAAEDQHVIELIDRMAGGGVDVIAFTSSSQVERLFEVAKSAQREERLQNALQATAIAAVGPVVAEDLRRRGLEVTITPDHSYFMKPLVTAIVTALSGEAPIRQNELIQGEGRDRDRIATAKGCRHWLTATADGRQGRPP